MIKVLFTETGDTGLGGSYHSLKNLVELISDEVECHVLYSNKPEVLPEGVNIYTYDGYDLITTKSICRTLANKIYFKLLSLFPKSKRTIDLIFRRSFLREIDKLITKKNIDIVHTNNQPFRDDFILKDNQNKNVRLVAHARTENIKGAIITHDSNGSVNYIFVSSSVKKLWNTVLNNSRGMVLNNFLASDIKRDNCKEEYSYCYLGRLIEGKGIFELIQAHVEILKKFPKAKLYIIGDGVLKNTIENKIREMEVPLESIELVGFIKDPQSYLRRIEVLVLPSKKEGFGRVLIEGMAQGCVAIGTRTGGIQDIIIDEENGLFLESVTPYEIEEKLIKLFLNKDLLAKYRKNAYGLLEEKFSSSKYKRKILSLYMEIT